MQQPFKTQGTQFAKGNSSGQLAMDENIKPVLRVLLERQPFRVFCEAVTINLLRGFP
jgi:hypothetical protein